MKNWDKPFIELDEGEFIIHANNVKPPVGYSKKDNYPDCCKPHRSILDSSIDWFNKFPNCCESHKNYLKQSWFDKGMFLYVPDKIVTQYHYTEFLIQAQINTDDWFEAITEYIEHNLQSFGTPNIGAERYFAAVISYISNSLGEDIKDCEGKKVRLLSWMETLKSPASETKEKVTIPSLNELHAIYNKWIKIFPFEISYFKELQTHFKAQFPVLYGKIKTNRYSGLSSAKLMTNEMLVNHLIETTKELLLKIQSDELIKNNLISDFDSHSFDLITEEHRIKQSALLIEFRADEMAYLKLIKKWLKNEQLFFDKVKGYIVKPQSKKEDPVKILAEKLSKTGFFELEKIKSLPDLGQNKIITFLIDNDMPSCIALLGYLDYNKLKSRRHFQNLNQFYKAVANMFDASERLVKGNFLVLNSYSVEDRKRYTAHHYMDDVAKFYEKLK